MSAPTPTPPPAHPAPPGWKPISVLALVSFLLSLVLLVVGATGPWYLLVVPLALALYTLFTFKPEANRGRGLAVWATMICLGGGSMVYAMHHSGLVHFTRVGESLLTALSAEAEPAERDKALALWTWSEALDKDPQLHQKWRARYEEAVAAAGPWTGEMNPSSPFDSMLALFSAPEGAREVGSGEAPPAWVMGSAFWVPARFERGTVYLALIVHDGGADAIKALQDEFKGVEPVALFGDLRFYRADD